MSHAAPDQPVVLSAHHIVKQFPGVRALDGVSFDLRGGEVHALVGENGAGKSTLIKVLAGAYPHGSYGGELRVAGRATRFRSVKDAEAAGVAVIHQELLLVPTLSVAENIYLGDEPRRFGVIDWDTMRDGAERATRRLGVAVNVLAEVASLGVGSQQLVEIARALRRRGRILILDEPTAALAEHETDRLLAILRELRRDGTAIVYISHKLDEVFALADRITVLRDGRTIRSDAAANWTRADVVHAMVGRRMDEMYPRFEHTPGDTVLRAEGMTMPDPDLPGRYLLRDVSLEVRRGEVLGLAGLMGSGRTTLLRTLFGAAPAPWTGRVWIGGRRATLHHPGEAIRHGLALAPEDRKRQGLVMAFGVQSNLSLAHLRSFSALGVIDESAEHERCARAAEELRIRAASLATPVETLSGGNQQKVVLGKWLLEPPRVLLLDEPTRGIDVGAKAEVHRLIGELTGRGMAVVMASSELPEVLGLSDRLLVLREGRVAGAFVGRDATAEEVMACAT